MSTDQAVPPTTELTSQENNIDPENLNEKCANSREDTSSGDNNNPVFTSIRCNGETSSSTFLLTGCNTGGFFLAKDLVNEDSAQKRPSATTTSSLVRKCNNNRNHSISKPSFPSLVIALLNTVRSGGSGGSNTVHLSQKEKGNSDEEASPSKESGAGNSSNSNANLKLKTRNKNTNGFTPTPNGANGNELESPKGEFGLYLLLKHHLQIWPPRLGDNWPFSCDLIHIFG